MILLLTLDSLDLSLYIYIQSKCMRITHYRNKMENMPPGYRFYPTEEELITFYLHNMLEGEKQYIIRTVIPVVNIYDYNPSQLPQISREASMKDKEQWFFFIPRQESEVRGGRPKRLTTTGYWKATGSPNHVYSSDNRVIGMKRTMVFYHGRAPNGKKTDWKMNEYKAIQDESGPKLRQEFSLSRVYKKSKCLRAFDRRPPPRRVTPCVQNVQEHKMNSTCDHDVQVLLDISPTSSPECSCSVDHGQPSHEVGEGSQMDTNVDYEPLFDWEQVDWFLGSEP
ncbi:NAC domain-containing protein 90 isoform X5 [Lathyrus oleraceus]|uniref:NAC domain-containing protein 90 isoform X5 n=1 Tax=Pisum sativum TaxID=3888 RepID=UPI0021CEC59A|nr:NAC domain-containing protein 90-like isoform X5 [Pisum sativum]